LVGEGALRQGIGGGVVWIDKARSRLDKPVFGRGVGVPEAFRYAGCGIRLGRMPNKRFLVSCVINDCLVVSRECKALWLIARGKPVQDRWSAGAPECSCSTKRPATTRGSIGGIPDESSCGVEGREAVTR